MCVQSPFALRRIRSAIRDSRGEDANGLGQGSASAPLGSRKVRLQAREIGGQASEPRRFVDNAAILTAAFPVVPGRFGLQPVDRQPAKTSPKRRFVDNVDILSAAIPVKPTFSGPIPARDEPATAVRQPRQKAICQATAQMTGARCKRPAGGGTDLFHLNAVEVA